MTDQSRRHREHPGQMRRPGHASADAALALPQLPSESHCGVEPGILRQPLVRRPQRPSKQFGSRLAFPQLAGSGLSARRARWNLIAAKAVAEAVMRHAREQPEFSLGVGCFFDQPARCRLARAGTSGRQERDREDFFAAHPEEPFRQEPGEHPRRRARCDHDFGRLLARCQRLSGDELRTYQRPRRRAPPQSFDLPSQTALRSVLLDHR